MCHCHCNCKADECHSQENAGATSNCRTIYFSGELEERRETIESRLRELAPSADLDWDEDALSVTLPVEEAQRLPLVLREFSAWLREHFPEAQWSYAAPVNVGEEEEEGEGLPKWLAGLARHRSKLLWSSAVVFALGLLLQRFAPFPVCLAVFVVAYLLAGTEILANAVRNLVNGEFLDEQFLMVVASLGAFAIGEAPEAVAVMLFYQVGEAFQRKAVGKSRQSIAAIMNLRPEYARLATPAGEQVVAPEEIAVGEEIVVNPGERIPLDGVVLSGRTMLDTSALTGESLPREAKPGDKVLSGCICQTAQLKLQVTKCAGESTVSRILALVEKASARKTPTERFIKVFSRYYTPAVVAGAVLLAVLPPLLLGLCGGAEMNLALWSSWIHRALVFLVVSCPCALVISVPLSYFGGIGAASRQNILVKGSVCLDALSKVTTVVFDKTGTLTQGAFRVQEVSPASGFSREELLDHAAHAESASRHPIALALRQAITQPIDTARLAMVEEVAGHGVKARLDGRLVLAGNRRFLLDNAIEEISTQAEGTVVHVAVDGRYAGSITIADQLKADSVLAVQALRNEGVKKIVMLTGDHRAVAEETATLLGLDGFHAELLPDQKVAMVEQLEREKLEGTKVAFVGDGINDAPVLARADLGIAMGGIGADAAVAAADAVLMTDQPSQVAMAIRIARKTLSIVRQNITFALTVKGAILLLGALGIANLWLAVFGDVGVAALATLNATRALRTDK